MLSAYATVSVAFNTPFVELITSGLRNAAPPYLLRSIDLPYAQAGLIGPAWGGGVGEIVSSVAGEVLLGEWVAATAVGAGDALVVAWTAAAAVGSVAGGTV